MELHRLFNSLKPANVLRHTTLHLFNILIHSSLPLHRLAIPLTCMTHKLFFRKMRTGDHNHLRCPMHPTTFNLNFHRIPINQTKEPRQTLLWQLVLPKIINNCDGLTLVTVKPLTGTIIHPHLRRITHLKSHSSLPTASWPSQPQHTRRLSRLLALLPSTYIPNTITIPTIHLSV